MVMVENPKICLQEDNVKNAALKILSGLGAFSILYGVFAGISDHEVAGAIALCAAAISYGVIAFAADAE